MTTNVYQIVTDKILEKLQQNVVPWRMPWNSTLPKNLISKKEYRGFNILITGCQGYASPYWLSYNQCKDLGGQVRKGEKSTPIVFYKVSEKKDASAEEIAKGRNKFFILRYYSAFNVLQCDGLDDKIPSEEKFERAPMQECEELISRYEGMPPIKTAQRAAYSPMRDEILMPPRASFNSVAGYYSTLFHEMTHSTGAKTRLDRVGVTDPIKFGSHNYSFEELIAECGAAFLCAKAGILPSTLDNSVAYIKSWSERLKSNPDWIVKAAGQASKSCDFIVGVKWESEVAEAAE